MAGSPYGSARHQGRDGRTVVDMKRALMSGRNWFMTMGRRGLIHATLEQGNGVADTLADEPIEYIENRKVLIPIVPGVFSRPIIDSIRANAYEAHEAAQLDSLIQTGEVILEIGAGCGFISTYCAKNPETKAVFCVEANPSLIPVIKLTHEINKVHVTVFHEILAKTDGETDFYVHEDFWASGTANWLGKKVVKVKTTAFQRRLNQVRPTMLVVDIEGGEVDLFDDVDLTGIKKIMVEIHQPTIGRRGVKKLFDTLSAQNFHYDMWHSTYSVVTFSHVDR